MSELASATTPSIELLIFNNNNSSEHERLFGAKAARARALSERGATLMGPIHGRANGSRIPPQFSQSSIYELWS
jgi:hypothetical protein